MEPKWGGGRAKERIFGRDRFINTAEREVENSRGGGFETVLLPTGKWITGGSAQVSTAYTKAQTGLTRTGQR